MGARAIRRLRPARPAAGLLLLLTAGCATAPVAGPERAEGAEGVEAWRTIFPDADTVRVAALAPGVRHVYLWLPEGPWALHVLAVDSACSPAIEARKAGPPLDARARTSELAGDAMAAINADFFMIPGGTPVGAHVTGGRVVAGPGRRPVYAIAAEGERWAGPAALGGWAAFPGDTAPVTRVNRPRDAGRHHEARPGLAVFDTWFGDAAPVDSSAPTLGLRQVDGGTDGGTLAGGGRAVVESIGAPGDRVPLGPGRTALQGHGPEAAAWILRRAVGDTVAWRAWVSPANGSGPAAREAVGGFPVLVSDGNDVLAAQEGVIPSFGEARHPRTAVGWDAEGGRVWWVVVDGRQPPYSEGMTLAELTGTLLRLGAVEAINLDGGGSTALVVHRQVANRPSDADGERAVANVLALTGCR